TPTAGSNPHGFLLDPTLTGRNLGQAEVLDFLASDGRTITDPDGPAPVFEVPIADPKSLETANYSRDTATGAPAAETASGATGSCAAVGASACAARSGFVSASVRPRGHGLRFAFVRRVRGLATVDVFQSSAGRSLTGNRLVVRFTGRRRSFTWNGRAARHRTVRDGVLFARLRVRVAPGVTDVRRFTLRRRGGRYALARSFYRRTSCGLLTEFKLGAPVFGGRGARAARLAYRLSSPARVSVQVLRGTRVVRGFAARSRSAHHTYRLRVPAGRLARGAYRVRIVAHRGTRTVRATLFAQRL
ncbi:MAG: hypothetical protein QOE28_634, partial [Solirubrobacteraceae bacterium]|nr:hypothetical protein [Solirubrobacteraceae bacterium]